MWKVKRQQTTSDGKCSHGLWQDELKEGKRENISLNNLNKLIWDLTKVHIICRNKKLLKRSATLKLETVC